MYANWIPQNIQKRLLLYILQQLSFFSGVDLPNLEEVSLNNIQLRDISIDPEKVNKIPGFSVRHGKLHAITLKAGVVDGVNIDVTGLDLVVAPNVDNLHQDLRDAQISLAQSTADLTQTVMLDPELKDPEAETNKPAEESKDPNVNPTTTIPVTPAIPVTPTNPASPDFKELKPEELKTDLKKPEQPRKSSLGGVMSKALEIALSRLHIRLRNVNIKLVVDPVDLVLEIDEISFSCKNGVKSVAVKGVSLSTPNACARGHQNESGSSEKEKENTSVSSSNSNSESEDSDSDSDSESGSDLTDSMIFTHAEASSIYMSATSESFAAKEKPAPAPESPATLLHIDSIQLSFEHLAPVSDLKIDIHSLKVASVPLVPTLSLVFNSLAKSIKLKNHHLRKGRFLSKKHKKTDNESSDTSDSEESDFMDEHLGSFFDKIHIAQLVVSLTAALDPSGEFASLQDELSIKFSNLTLKQKDKNLTYGGVETVEMLRHIAGVQSTVFSFSSQNPSSQISVQSDASATHLNPPTRAEVRFEYLRNPDPSSLTASELTVLISKPASCTLDVYSVQYILDLVSSLSVAGETFSTMAHDFAQMNELVANEKPLANSAVKNQVILQTASFDLNVTLSQNRALKAVVFPISYNKLEDHCYIHKIVISNVSGEIESPLLTVPSVKLTTKTKDFSFYQFSSSGVSPRKASSRCSKFVHVGAISGSIDHRQLLLLVRDITAFSSELKSTESAFESQVKDQPPSLASSLYAQNRMRRMKYSSSSGYSLVSFCMSLKSIDFDIRGVSEKFGDLKMSVGRCEILQLNNDIIGNVHSVSLDRVHDQKSSILTTLAKGIEHPPMIQFSSKSSEVKSTVEFVLRKAFINVYSEWQSLLSKSDFSSEARVEQKTHSASNSRQKTDYRFNLYELVLGVTPGRLSSKLILVIGKGSSEFIMNDVEMQSKSSIRDIEILLTDDIKHVKNDLQFDVSPSTALLSSGFVDIGKVNTAHIGLNIFTDLESVKRDIELTDGHKNLSNVSFKLNLDDLAISVCADSAHTLAQTVNDLKEPVIFKDEDKFRLGAHQAHQTTEEILSELKHAIGMQVTDNSEEVSVSEERTKSTDNAENAKSETEEFHIVEHYYDDNLESSNLSDEVRKLDLEDSSTQEDSSISFVEGHFSEKQKASCLTVVPLHMEVNLSKASVFLFDGYDWKMTRKTLRRAVQKLEKRASEVAEKQSHDEDSKSATDQRSQDPHVSEEPEEEILGLAGITETLFQSIHISTDEKLDVPNLVQVMNYQMQGETSEQGDDSHLNVNVGKHYKDLVLHRSHHHKILLEVQKVGVTVVNFTDRDPRVDETPEDLEFEVVNKIEVRVDTFTVFDNVPTSTWNRFLTYMSILGDREIGSNMLAFSLTNVRPDPELAFTEAVIDVQILPVRFYVDQDTLEFLMRFGEFKDSRFNLPLDEIMYVQKLTIHPLRIKFDYKPKKIDYTGIRAGKNAELINFFILDGSDVTLKKAVIHGAHGFTKVGEALGRVYAPYIQKYQLTGLLSGLSPVKSAFNIGTGVKDLVAIPVQEYKRDGRLLYGLQKGTKSFAKITTNELLKLGIKLASGTQVFLENSEEYFGGEGVSARRNSVGAPASKDESPKPIPKRGNLMETSQVLRRSVANEEPTAKPRVYAISAIDEEDSDPEIGRMQSSILAFENPNMESSINEEEIETDEKLISLYSNQPNNLSEGLKSAYKSLGKNLKSTKKRISDLRHELKDSDTFQDQLTTVAKSSPVIVIRPIIGTTEAMMKTLMGVSNGIDSSRLKESHDKYRDEQKRS